MSKLSRLGLFTPLLLEASVRGSDPGWLTADGDPEKAKSRAAAVRASLDLQVVTFPRELRTEDGWEPVQLTVEDLDTMDGRDVDLLEDIVLRLRTPEEVTAISEAVLAGRPDAYAESEDPAALGWVDFRGERGRDEGRDDGPVLAAAAEPDAEGR